jgi:hypothetical protein
MQAPKNRKVTFPLSMAMMTIVLLASCSDSTGPQWEYAGIHHVRVLQLNVAETIASDDTLSILLIGDTLPMGRLSLDRIDVVRDTMGIELTVWAKVEKWVGSGIVPPYDHMIHCDYNALPPFNKGQFRVVVHQPDGSQLVASVLVGP